MLKEWLSYVYVLIFAFAGLTVNSWQIGQLAQMPTCAEEDGNQDGNPCLWVDPTDGHVWYISSEEYRNENDDPNSGMTGQR